MKILKTISGVDFVIDDEVAKWASSSKWTIDKDGYVCLADRRRQSLHSMILTGGGNGFHVDHINGNKLDNLRSNLRLLTVRENLTLNAGRRSDNTSGYRGVYYRKDRNTWSAEVKCDGIKYCLGCYKDPKEAAMVWNKKAKELFGNKVRLNEV
jgi:hypothetical protein